MVEYRGVQKELAFFFNGMRLHELYFGIIGGENMNKMDPALVNDIKKNFGSFAKWKTNFIETGRISGVGFVALCRDRSNGLLCNNWINEFDIGAQLIGTDIILVMDMWEHAYIAEFGLDLKKYCETYLNNVNWSVVSTLYNVSLHKKINHLFVR